MALKHTRYLNCSILAHQKFLNSTPLDFIVFTPNSTLARDGFPPFWLRAPNIKIIPAELPWLDVEVGSRNVNKYMQMGQWRLVNQFRAVRDLGYRFMLQSDDDALPFDFIDENIVEVMRRGHHMGGYCRDW